ncbi:hypothetical protein [Stigmatella aurantiaca]|uniref:Conserved uncharacterized protein n=1 Tax=Stigmatella aurantiaca (strain DW4/3-1) TaxID=378806 RepID=Q090K1_STIAD|nr:hypothetical protein [Stigmatella aurantiaca]ADO73452.1 conserved uncharacterized protein [Stigmatella aurantiaca DW4/3-1]EAU66164.1 hypothetical protein STIAU_5322 [Stigmatella aurantiaca DW4/3-1]
MLRRLAVASVLVTAACAGQQKPSAGGQPMTKEERTRITNQPAFDVAICQSRPISLPQPPNQAFLVGALVSARPQIMECLVDPKHRAGAETTKVTVKTRLTEQEATHALTGENLTPEGQKCIQDAVNTLIPLQPLAKGSQPLEAETQFVHERNNSPTVTMGINEGSDFSGAVRLAQAQWCDCYAGYTTQAPPLLTARIKLTQASQTPAEITFEPSGSTEGDQLAACLKEKMTPLPAKISSQELTFPYRFVHFHAQATEPTASMAPDLRFLQLELVRNQRTAHTAIALGTRENAAATYEALANEYRKNPRKNYELIPKLREKCAALESSAEAWVSAVEAQLAVDQQTTALIQELKAKDPAWADAELASQNSLSKTQADLQTAKQRRQDDANVCKPLK